MHVRANNAHSSFFPTFNSPRTNLNHPPFYFSLSFFFLLLLLEQPPPVPPLSTLSLSSLLSLSLSLSPTENKNMPTTTTILATLLQAAGAAASSARDRLAGLARLYRRWDRRWRPQLAYALFLVRLRLHRGRYRRELLRARVVAGLRRRRFEIVWVAGSLMRWLAFL